MEICIYCEGPRGDKMGCCGENHWDEVDGEEYYINIKENNMTTKVKIEITQKHMPVIVEILREDVVTQTQTLSQIGEVVEEYVHSGQMLLVREMTIEEKQNHDTGEA